MDHQNTHTAFLCLGSNLGIKTRNLEQAASLIGSRCGIVEDSSGIYQSKPWGFDSDNDFYNQCLKVKTRLDPVSLLENILAIEQEIGRERKGTTYSDRLIDIDILFYDELIYESEDLVLPHSRLENRMFVLKPMLELDADFVRFHLGCPC